jgi:hypothetical protein
MNIFFLDLLPDVAAQMQCDKHVVKMVLESAQMLSTCHHVLESPVAPHVYRKTHANHPCNIWLRESADNYMWLYEHFLALGDEYTYRYGKVHKSIRERAHYLELPPPALDFIGYTTPPQCMPDEYKCDDVVLAYQNYYICDKSRFAVWNKARPAPDWWPL